MSGDAGAGGKGGEVEKGGKCAKGMRVVGRIVRQNPWDAKTQIIHTSVKIILQNVRRIAERR